MLTTATQRIALVIGAFWTLFVVSATLTEIFEGSGWGKMIGGAAIGGCQPPCSGISRASCAPYSTGFEVPEWLT